MSMSEPMPKGKLVAVNSAQVMAARTRIIHLQERGEDVPNSLWRIANARRPDNTPIRIGIAKLDEPFLTPEEIATTQPELSAAILDGIHAMVHTLEQS